MSLPFTLPSALPGSGLLEEETRAPESYAGLVEDLRIRSKGRGRLLYQYRGKPRIEALVTVLLDPLQDAHDAAWDLLTRTSIDTAEGAQLDVLGRLVGEPRGSRDDTTYRAWIRARMRANRSEGRLYDFVETLQLLFPGAAVWVLDKPPQAVQVHLRTAVGTLATDVGTIVQDLRSAASRAEFVYTVGSPGVSLSWGSNWSAQWGGVYG